MACNCISRKTAKCFVCVSLPSLAILIVASVMFPTIYNTILTKELSLTDGTIMTGFWKDIPLPLYFKIYLFNVTNRDDFIAGHNPLNVTEVGPYVYKSHWVKKHPTWNDNNTVSYRETRTFIFDPEMSVGTEDDEIYSLNGPMILASNIVKDFPFYEKIALSSMFGVEGEHVVTKKTVRDLVFVGYKDPIIKYAPVLKPDIPYKEGIFAWLYGKNDTDDGIYTLFTGVGDTSKRAIINNWKGQEKLNFWKNDTCNMINGSNIETGPPIKDDQGSYSFFQSLICRTLTLRYTNDVSHFDILTKRFRPTYDLLANSTENPNNYCFEVNKEHPSGVLDLGPCQFGASVYLSYAHFYMADKKYLEHVNGLNPNDEEHGSHLDADPITGITIDANIRIQLNVEIEQIPYIVQLKGVTEGIFPVLWIDITFSFNEGLANFFKGMLRIPKIIAYSLFGAFTVIFFILAIIGIIVLVSSEHDDDEPLLDAANGKKPPYKKLDNVLHKNEMKEKSCESSNNGSYETDNSTASKASKDPNLTKGD